MKTMRIKLYAAQQPVITGRLARSRNGDSRPRNASAPACRPTPVSPVDARLVLDEYLPYQLARLSSYLGQALFERHRGFSGMTASEWRVVAVLGPSAAMSAAEIASTSRLDQVAIHRAVKGLLDMGYVVRGTTGNDKRRKPLTLTRRGQAIYRRIAPLARELEREMFAFVDPSQERMLRKALSDICAGFGLGTVATVPADEVAP
jgi:DNA-binding MarR family transcriptional regulator